MLGTHSMGRAGAVEGRNGCTTDDATEGATEEATDEATEAVSEALDSLLW